ncbi:PAS domain S-box protein [Spirosoma utsteinense]|uniref:histidine kinase n=1 Tax=Spirosoma utsteinense TaxID=2585773 RepID=A0ABR6WDF3_9BACT|nr:PAS domain S-box protein [Spirosoma utsteinense]MBC3789108.1 PAS domain S-box-containing protein [Spirosoma utsteinense]MBC3794528.1 PAS domain S-box-containing protein [Spirosoma utsteinense]
MTTLSGNVVSTGITEFEPNDRTQFFCHPVFTEQGQLIDLEIHTTGLPAVRGERFYLSAWITPEPGNTLESIWKTLQQGRGCRVAYQPASGKPGTVQITPLQPGYLLEIQEDESTEPAFDHSSATPYATTQLLEAILSNAPTGLSLFKPVWENGQIKDFVCLVTNAVNATITGYSIEKLVAHSLTTLFPGAISLGLLDRMIDVALTGTPQQYQKHVKNDDFSVWGQFTISRVGNNVLFTVIDISALKKAKFLLNEQNAKLRKRILARTRQIQNLSTLQNAILKYAGQAIVSTDVHGIIQTANQACEKLVGYLPLELVGMTSQLNPGVGENSLPVASFHDYRPGDAYVPFLKRALEGRDFVNLECVAVHKSGRLVPVLLASSVLQNEEGETIGYMGIASDISALKSAEAGLKQKNRELNTFFDGALDMHCISDSQGTILTVNRSSQSTLGYTAEELTAIPFLSLIHPDEQKSVNRELLSKIIQQPVRNQINRMQRKDGTYRTIEWNAIAIDQVIYGSARDITGRQETETELRNLNQRLQLATEAAGQGIWEIDLRKNRVFWDKRLWEINGMEPNTGNWTFEEFIKTIHPEDRSAFLKKSTQELAGTDTSISHVYRIIRPEGTIRYIETSGRIIRDEKQRPQRLIGVAWDMTSRKLADDTLRESELRFREIAENVDEVFWIHSPEPFQLLYVNPAYERLFNATSAQLYSRPRSFIEAIVDKDKRAVLTFLSKYRAGQEGHLDCQLKRPDGAVRWLSIRTFIIRDESGQIVRHIAIGNDVTSQKEKEFVLRQSLFREQELNQLKSQFVSTASHEFRTPLTTIQSSVDLIRLYLEMPAVSARQSIQNHLDVIQKEIEKFSNLLTDMLTIGKIEAGKITFTPRPTDVTSLCRSLIATHFSKRLDNRTVQLRIEGTPHPVFIDDKLMGHVLVNLLSNAFKFSTDTSPRLRIVFRKNSLMLQVVDTGIGIPASELSALFQAFFRASNTAGIPGTGLGLVIARQFIELHQGHLDVQSVEKKGTTFSIHLPTEDRQQQSQTRPN